MGQWFPREAWMSVHNYLQTFGLNYLKLFLVSVGTVDPIEPSFHSKAQDRTNGCLVKQEFIV
jgi:hypothetical protein